MISKKRKYTSIVSIWNRTKIINEMYEREKRFTCTILWGRYSGSGEVVRKFVKNTFHTAGPGVQDSVIIKDDFNVVGIEIVISHNV